MKTDYKIVGQLVARAKENDSSSFTQLYELTYQKLYFLALSILKNEADAEDALQETYMKIFTSLQNLEDGTLFIAWANRIIYNICMRMLEKRRDILVGDEQLLAIPDDKEEYNPLSSCILNEKKHHLAHLIESLDPVLRTCIILKYYNNMKVSEISIVMECPEGTVKSRLNTAKKQLLQMATKERSKDMWLNSFIMLPIGGTLKEAAKRISLSPDKAMNTLMGSLNNAGFSTNVSFQPASSISSMGSTGASIAIVSGSVLTTLTIGCIVAMQIVSPSFVEIEIPQELTAKPVSLIAKMGDIPKTEEVYAIRGDGTKLDGVGSDSEFTIVIPENGRYTIFAIGKNDKVISETITLTTMDFQAPHLTSYSNTEDTFIISVQDDLAGIDYDKIFLEVNGERYSPISVDFETSSVTFDLPKAELAILSISDMLGNLAEFDVEIFKKNK